MRWHFLGRQSRPGRQRTHSRPRVARAALAARSVQAEMGAGSMRDGGGVQLAGGFVLALDMPARPSGLGSAELAASPAALLSAARAANRTVEEVWEETLAVWLNGEQAATQARPSEAVGQRRRNVWHEIDSTLLMLRAG